MSNSYCQTYKHYGKLLWITLEKTVCPLPIPNTLFVAAYFICRLVVVMNIL